MQTCNFAKYEKTGLQKPPPSAQRPASGWLCSSLSPVVKFAPYYHRRHHQQPEASSLTNFLTSCKLKFNLSNPSEEKRVRSVNSAPETPFLPHYFLRPLPSYIYS